MKHERIEVQTENGTAWLERLTPRQLISFGDTIWSDQRKRLIQDMKDADVGSAERMKALQEHEQKRGLMSEIIPYAITIHGALEMIAEASKGKNAENADGLPHNFVGTSEESMRIALDLIGAELQSESEDKDTKPKKKK